MFLFVMGSYGVGLTSVGRTWYCYYQRSRLGHSCNKLSVKWSYIWQFVFAWLDISILFLISKCCLCLNGIYVAADYDLTGQLIWPGAMLLNNYLSKNSHLIEGHSIIELGSGVGKMRWLLLVLLYWCLLVDDDDCPVWFPALFHESWL